ncbi:MAG: GAF domain-containing protein [Anaerolineales bacterium]|jgi:GAF domain-containing protein
MTSSDTQTIRHLQGENIRLRSENSSLKNYVERLQRALSALVDLQKSIDAITPETNVYLLIHQMLEAALIAVDSKNGSLLLLDEETGELVFVEVIGEAREKLLNYRLAKGQGIAGWSVAKRQPRLVTNTKNEPEFSAMVDRYTGMETKSLICIPLLDGERRLGAVEVVNTRTGRPLAEEDMDVLQLVGKLASLAIIEAERASQEAKQQSG